MAKSLPMKSAAVPEYSSPSAGGHNCKQHFSIFQSCKSEKGVSPMFILR